MFAMELWAVPDVVSYLQAAVSLVVIDRVVEVVPDDNEPDGAPFDITGGVVSVAV